MLVICIIKDNSRYIFIYVAPIAHIRTLSKLRCPGFMLMLKQDITMQ